MRSSSTAANSEVLKEDHTDGLDHSLDQIERYWQQEYDGGTLEEDFSARRRFTEGIEVVLQADKYRARLAQVEDRLRYKREKLPNPAKLSSEGQPETRKDKLLKDIPQLLTE